MRVAMYYNNSDVRLQEAPRPRIASKELLIRTQASGICGSDVMEWYRVRRAPLVLGHEVAGEIVEVGEELDNWTLGQRVIATHHVPCFQCYYCQRGHHTCCDTLRSTTFDPGGFSELIRLPEVNVKFGTLALPDAVGWDEATFTEPLGCVIRGLNRTGFKAGDSVAVIGCGITGLLFVKLTFALGARKVFAYDIDEHRVALAEQYGATALHSSGENFADKIRELNDGMLADRVVVCAGAAPAIKNGFESVERGGDLLLFAPTGEGVTLELPLQEALWGRDVSVTSSYAAAPDDLREALKLIANGTVTVSDMITHRLPLAETQTGFCLVEGGGKALKVVIRPQE